MSYYIKNRHFLSLILTCIHKSFMKVKNIRVNLICLWWERPFDFFFHKLKIFLIFFSSQAIINSKTLHSWQLSVNWIKIQNFIQLSVNCVKIQNFIQLCFSIKWNCKNSNSIYILIFSVIQQSEKQCLSESLKNIYK